MNSQHNAIAIWWRSFRFHYVAPSFLPAILGSVIAWAVAGKFHFGYFLLTVLGVTLNHIALNMTDDYFDFHHSVDRLDNQETNPYSGGSGTLTAGLIRPEHMRLAFLTGYLLTSAIGFYLSAVRGWMVLVFGAFGMASAYFYSAPPVHYGYRGFGELSHLINFSFTIGMGSYFVQAQRLSWEAFWAILPLGFMMFCMITINEIPDEENDRSAGKNNLVVRFGTKIAAWLYGASLSMAYLIILITPMIGKTSQWIYLGLLTIPLAVKALILVNRHYRDPLNLAPANLLTIQIHNLTGILLIIAYCIQGILDHRSVSHMALLLMVLALIYTPVALTVFFDVIGVKPLKSTRV